MTEVSGSISRDPAEPGGAGGYNPNNRVLIAKLEPLVGEAALQRFMAENGFTYAPDAKPRRAARWHEWVLGTAPALSRACDKPATPVMAALDLVNCCLRGIGQVMFMNNPFTGAAILLALFWQSLYVASFGVLGLVASTGAAIALQLDRGAEAGDCQVGDWRYSYVAFPVLLFAVLSTIISVALGNVLVPVYSVPAFTLPFNLAMLLFVGTALNSRSFPQPFTQSLLASDGGVEEYEVEWARVFEAIPKGVGQVFLADSTVSGGVISGALFLCSPTAALAALVGSAIGAFTALAMQAPVEGIYAGLWGYNAVPGCMAIGGVFFYPSRTAAVLACLCAITCAYTGGLLAVVMHPLGLPSGTLPFCFGTLLFALLQESVPSLEPVPLSDITTPENHYLQRRALPDALQSPAA
ncbi:urea transporter-domain-containing protein [Baffinella frigidus]|nr:urea transporter-domain-containing protein [Cryptophyta sp. CCMP2293]